MIEDLHIGELVLGAYAAGRHAEAKFHQTPTICDQLVEKSSLPIMMLQRKSSSFKPL